MILKMPAAAPAVLTRYGLIALDFAEGRTGALKAVSGTIGYGMNKQKAPLIKLRGAHVQGWTRADQFQPVHCFKPGVDSGKLL